MHDCSLDFFVDTSFGPTPFGPVRFGSVVPFGSTAGAPPRDPVAPFCAATAEGGWVITTMEIITRMDSSGMPDHNFVMSLAPVFCI
jgi:hypothetical protein